MGVARGSLGESVRARYTNLLTHLLGGCDFFPLKLVYTSMRKVRAFHFATPF